MRPRSHRTVVVALLTGAVAAGCAGGSVAVELPVYEVWVGDDDLTVYAEVGHGNCDELGDLAVEETDSGVAVVARAERSTGECTAEEVISQLTAVLGRPLGDRELEAWPATSG